jgi:glycosyltransferase involved in cell wall biosynthesis
LNNNNKSRPKVYATLPVLNESEHILRLYNDLQSQQSVRWQLVVCVNQPEEWWQQHEKTALCADNQKTLSLLEKLQDERISIIDRSSPGKGWKGAKHGVGWARKTAMDRAATMASPDDLMVTIDADTHYPPSFFAEIVNQLNSHPDAVGLSAPYYHPLTGNEDADRSMLRYECYMRNYALNMLLIRNPYGFTAIGSGMACTMRNYHRVGGLTPKMSGEDFYFMQKLRKAGPIIIDLPVKVYPEARFSDRVYFGTGPAMIKGNQGNWSSYPIYHEKSFVKIKETYDSFMQLYDHDIPTPMDNFIEQNFGLTQFWETLRKNAASAATFVKSCQHRLDGLRILQFLKYDKSHYQESEESTLLNFLSTHFQGFRTLDLPEPFSFSHCSVESLNRLRNFMVYHEEILQHKIKTL